MGGVSVVYSKILLIINFVEKLTAPQKNSIKFGFLFGLHYLCSKLKTIGNENNKGFICDASYRGASRVQ